MSKIDQIQRVLLELDGGRFQKLADAYLHKKGYDGITPFGSVIGADKVRRGTPDTFFNPPNGKYVLAEYTTQQTDIYEKFEKDLEKCFEVMKTGVPVDEIVLCYTSILSPTEVNNLAVKCQTHEVNLNIYGIGEISYDLYQKYPGLAHDLLGVEIDTGQIVPPDEFIAVYNKNKLATRLDTAFYSRKDEAKRVLQELNEKDMVIISGRAGIGKSRLALECCKQFKDVHSDYDIKCIYNRGLDLYEDLRVYFSESGYFLILVDDANRTSRFDYIVQLLRGQHEDQQIKVIVTVRDYALSKVLESASSQGDIPVIELHSLDDDQIKLLVEEEFGILNSHYLDRIADIAKGNPRLAVMAAEVAKQENNLESIIDVTVLYDKYFASIRRDLEELNDRNLLKAAGIVAFFQVVDRSNKEMMEAIESAFEMTSETFWEVARKLNDLEVIDMFENEVVKISDQVLSTYLFYLAFFKENVLSFSILLDHFFPKYRHRLVDTINPILNTFDKEAIKEAMHKDVDKAWESLKEMDKNESFLHLMEVFWFLKPTDTLLYIKTWIEETDAKHIDPSKIEFKANAWIPSPSLLRVLSSFKYGDNASFRIALTLLFDYIAKRPDEIPQLLHILTDKFGFTHKSYLNGFRIQQEVIDILWKFAKKGQDNLFPEIFLSIAENYLQINFHTVELRDRHTFSMINFKLPPTPELFKLRRIIWMNVFCLYQVSAFKARILNILGNYCISNYPDSVKEIVAQDSLDVLPFIDLELNPKSYRYCVRVHEYLKLLGRNGILFDKTLMDKFNNAAYKLSKLLFSDISEKKDLGLSHDEYKQLKKKQIDEHFRNYIFSDYEQFFGLCIEIYSELYQSRMDYQIQMESINILLSLADREPGLYIDVLEYYLTLGDPLDLTSMPLSLRLIEKLTEICRAERSYEILSWPYNPTKRIWTFGYYMTLSSVDVTSEPLDKLYSLFQEANGTELPRSLDFLLKYRSLDNKVVVRVIGIILDKAKADPFYAHALSSLFNHYAGINKELIDIFANDENLLKQAYFAVLKIESYMDYDGQSFSRILDIEPDFILEYIDHVYETEKMPNSLEDNRDYAFLWMRDDYERLMMRAAERVFEHELEQRAFIGTYTYLTTFFVLRENGKKYPEIVEKQDRLLKRLIEQQHSNLDFMQFIFGVVANCSPKRRRQFVATFLDYNKSFEAFSKLSLEPNSWGWSGSAVPMLQGRVDYFEALLPLLDEVQFLQHKQHIERIIQGIRMSIEEEKKKDFMGD